MNNTLLKKLDYTFQDASILKVALTHRSKGDDHNERLEFLGDAVVNFVVADILFDHFPKASEGELSRWRASLVNRDALAELGKQFDLGQYMILGPGEVRSGGAERQSIISCGMEAIIGAIYMDGGFDVVRDKLIAWYEPLINTLTSAANYKDPKTLLQEYLQRRHLALPAYQVVETEGAAHRQVFTVTCQVEGVEASTTGKGTSRRRAEQEAALAMLAKIK